MIERYCITKLRQWRMSEDRRPLILRGPRQVGKTTIVNEFSKEFDNYLYLNLEKESDRSPFAMSMPLRDIVALLLARKGVNRTHGDTLIFIDEIQNSPQAVASLRYFFEELPEYFVIAAGSLLENMVDLKVSFPVGRVDFLPVHPCSFREFLSATGRAPELLNMTNPDYTPPFHAEYLSLFNSYCIIGGMPEVVQHYVDHGDVLAVDHICSRLMRAYSDDVEKYCKHNKLLQVVRHIIQYGWGEAGGIITLGGFGGSPYKAREVGEAFRLLQKAMLLELVYPSTSVVLPSMPEMRRQPKLLWFDTGLVNYMAKVRKALIGSDDILDIWRGRLGEQIVGQELLTLSDDINTRRTFWTKGKGESGAEVDFTWALDSNVIPIEVKTGHNAHLKSLHAFMDLSPVDVAVRVWSGPFSVNELVTSIAKKPFKLINLPFYLVWDLENIVRQHLS